MPYNPEHLSGSDPTKLTWAIAWARFVLHDTTTPEQFTDVELTAVLTSTAVVVNTVTYYRPHHAAAALIEADPTRVQSESLLSASVTNRDPGSIARGIRRQSTWVDDLIEAASGTRPVSSTTLEVTW